MLILFCILGWLFTILLLYYYISLKEKYRPNKNLNFVDIIYIGSVYNKGLYYGTINTIDNYGNAIVLYKHNISCAYSTDAKRTVKEYFEKICENFGFDKDTGKKL